MSLGKKSKQILNNKFRCLPIQLKITNIKNLIKIINKKDINKTIRKEKHLNQYKK